MCKTCDDGICTNRCATQTTVTKVTKITPPPVEGAVGGEARPMMQRLILKPRAIDWTYQYQGDFSMSERQITLIKRVEKYFAESMQVGFHQSIQKSRSLTQWCDENGYSSEELQAAKRSLMARPTTDQLR